VLHKQVEPPPLVKKALCTADVAADQCLAYWLEMICSLYCDLECTPPEEEGPFGEVEFSRIGNVDVSHLRSKGQRVWRTPQRIRVSNENHCLVVLQREGRAVVRQDRRAAIANPGSFAYS
jgi:hypothetical protein